MASIRFTDADGTWLLHNAKPYPADRFTNWIPNSTPFGDSASRQSDGQSTMIRLRTDYAATFELPMIPSVRSANVIVQSENLGLTWTAVGTPTRSAAAHTASGINLDLIGDDDGAALEYYRQNLIFTGNGAKALSAYVKKGTSPAVGGSLIALTDATASVDRLTATITWSGTAPSVAMGVGTYLGYELMWDAVYRLLFTSTSVTAANTNQILLEPAATLAQTGDLYVGGIQAENVTTPGPYLATTTAALPATSQAEIADRLLFHLLNGGTCALQASDAVGSSYASCSLKPGTTPQVTLDRHTFDVTLQVALLNVAGSPVRMNARYAEQ